MKVRNLEFKQTGGPYGDETSRYDVHFYEKFTLEDFIKSIQEDSAKDDNCHGWWGEFFVYDLYTPRGQSYIYEYRAGKLYYGKYVSQEEADSIYKRNKNKIVNKLVAHGGWGNMDYHIYLDIEEEKQ